MNKSQLINEVVELQRKAGRTLGAYAFSVLIESGLSMTQLKSLFLINSGGDINFRKLAEALGVTPSDVTVIVNRLVKQGLVSRTENPEDRRMMMLQVTDKGHALLANLRESGMKHMTEILTLLSPEELSALAQGLSAFIRAANASNGEISK